VGLRLFVLQGQLLDGRDQALRDEAPAVRAEVPRLTARHAHVTLSINAKIRAWSLIPGADSTPLLTSTANGRHVRTACATLSGVSPPASTHGRGGRKPPEAASSSQSKRRPVPPAAPGAYASKKSASASP